MTQSIINRGFINILFSVSNCVQIVKRKFIKRNLNTKNLEFTNYEIADNAK